MRKNGNIKSNVYFNPDPKKHPPPLSQEDSDSNMERHIRAKYEYQNFRRGPTNGLRDSVGSSGAGSSSFGVSTGSDASSLPLSSNSNSGGKASTLPKKSKLSMSFFRSSSPSSAKVNQILGTNTAPFSDAPQPPRPTPKRGSVAFPHGMATATPLELYGDQIKSLREMGFTNVSQCLEVLQKTDGRMMQAVEILIRLNKAEDKRPEPPPKNEPFGLTVHKTGPATLQRPVRTGESVSNNPFDALDKEAPLPPLPRSAQSTGSSVPLQTSLSLPGQLSTYQQQQTMGAQVGWNGAAVNGGYSASSFQMNIMAQALPTPQSNPFQQQQLQQAAQPLYPMTTGSTASSYNPFMTPSSPPQQPIFSPSQQLRVAQSQPNIQAGMSPGSQLFQPQPPQPSATFPLAAPYQIQPNFNFYAQQQQQLMSTSTTHPSFSQQQLMPQRSGYDKNSILALYSAPQLAPPRAQNQVEVKTSPQFQEPASPQQPQTGSNNPFANGAGAGGSAGAVGTNGNASRESVDFGGWQTGRHSPDAFASLAFGGR
jgi:hypothetical protein